MLGDLVAVLPLEGIGVVGILLTFYFALLKGWIVIGSTHREQLEEKDTRNSITETALLKSLDLNTSQAQTIAKQTAVSDLAAHLLDELKKDSKTGAE